MSNSTGDVSRFRSIIGAAGGLTKPSSFKMIVTPPPGLRAANDTELLSFLCSSSEIPPMLLEVIPYLKQGYGLVSAAPTGAHFSDLTAYFFSDNDGKMLSFFHRWLNLIFDFNGSGEIEYRQNYVTSLIIKIFDERLETPVVEFTLHEAYPMLIGQERLDWQNGHKLVDIPIRFVYKYWTSDKINR